MEYLCVCFLLFVVPVLFVCVFVYSNLIPEIYGCFCQMPIQPYQSRITLVHILASGFPGLFKWYKFGLKDCVG